MLIAILGGTGKEGAGLAQRWAMAGHQVIIGSRDAERARAKAAELSPPADETSITGMSNLDAATAAPVVVLTLPAAGLAATLVPLREACRGKVVISTVVPLTFGGGRLFTPPPQGWRPRKSRIYWDRRREWSPPSTTSLPMSFRPPSTPLSATSSSVAETPRPRRSRANSARAWACAPSMWER